ncbi:Alpha/Beta hydrolase protein [Tirmania nivea]|nr:Alpha/Beta hydrolase protein [Tirmania nivea]
MPLTPSLSIKVPSLYDYKLLETRIYIPHQELQHAKSVLDISDPRDGRRRAWFRNKKAAVVAHPYATLGGNYNDNVVMNVVNALLQRGWVVATFNFRGAGKSGGSTSWTGKPEIGDYQGILGAVMSFVDALGESDAERGRGRSEDTNIQSGIVARRMKVLMAGYSYGSLITSHLPPVDELSQQIDMGIEKSPEYKACIEGLRASGRAWGHSSLPITEAPGVFEISGIEIQPSYLLISPLLPPLSSFLTLSIFSAATTSSIMSEELGKHKRGCILVVHGDTDMFTSAAKYRKWRETWIVTEEVGVIQTRTVVEIAGAGHLWIEEGVIVQLVKAIGEWADGLSVQE